MDACIILSFFPWGHEQSTTPSFALPLTSPLPSEKRKNGQNIMKLDWGESRWRNYQDKQKHSCNRGVASLSSLVASIIDPIGYKCLFSRAKLGGHIQYRPPMGTVSPSNIKHLKGNTKKEFSSQIFCWVCQFATYIYIYSCHKQMLPQVGWHLPKN